MPLDLAPPASSYVADALEVCLGAFVDGVTPPPDRYASEWAEEKRYVAAESGSPFPGKWSNATAPELVEIMDCMSFCHPARRVSVKKSRQVGGSECGVNLIGHTIDETPGPVALVLPSIEESKTYVRVKLQPTIEATPALRNRVLEQKSRDEDGSTTSFKKFPGGFLRVTGANSSKGLKMISTRVIIFEEVSEYPSDVDNQGDPVGIAEKMSIAWNGRHDKKIFISTPGFKGQCRVSLEFERSDQRFRHVPCPHCGAYQPLEFKQLRYDEAKYQPGKPLEAWYECAVNGCVIEHREKRGMLAKGKWVAKFGDEGREPGFHLNQLYSRAVNWGEIVVDYLESKDDPRKLKVFVTQVLAEEYEDKGEAPDHEKLLTRREAWRQGVIPPGVLFLTAGVDVQGNRLEFAVFGWGVGLSCWPIDRGIIEGDPNQPAVWAELDRLVGRHYVDARGRTWPIDAIGIDSGYLSSRVYVFVARYFGSNRVFALDGRPGWRLGPLGTPQKKAIDFEGKRVGEVMLWPVGTWDMKSEIYFSLGLLGQGADPASGRFKPGTFFLPDWVDEAWVKQLVAEYLIERPRPDGMVERRWVKPPSERNEALDMAVYARSLAHHFSDKLTPAAWAALAARRGEDEQEAQLDLARLWTPGLDLKETPLEQIRAEVNKAAGAPPPTPPRPTPQLAPRPGWIGGTRKNWLR